MKKAYEDGSMMECAKKYGVHESIVEQKQIRKDTEYGTYNRTISHSY